MKAGYKTSEFWFTLVSFIFSGLYLTGLIKESENKDQLIEIVSHAVESCILISGQIFILYKYIKGRSSVKQSWWNSQVNSPQEPKEEVKNDNKPRTNKTRSRKTNTKNKRKTSGS